jgi:acyl-coenzyme A thioesterase PaaI-like protein
MDTSFRNVAALPVVGGAAALLVFKLVAARRDSNDATRSPPPSWLDELEDDESYERVRLPEWDNGASWRQRNGFKGSDFVHGALAAVHVPRYYLRGVAGGVGSKLVGASHFGPGAESHRGLCHGGTMCSLMDDVVGWTGFCASGQCLPWSGFTVQINTSLKRPVGVGAWLRLEGEIVRIEGQKVSVRARLLGAEGAVHCEAEGLVVLKKLYV